MKNILNLSTISLKPIFMSLAILFTTGVSFPNHFEKVVSASLPSDDFVEEETAPDDGNNDYNPICRTYRGSNDPNFIKNYRKEDSEEEEEEEGYDTSNEYYDEKAKKAWEEFHNTLFGESEYYEAFVREFNEKCWFA